MVSGSAKELEYTSDILPSITVDELSNYFKKATFSFKDHYERKGNKDVVLTDWEKSEESENIYVR